MTKDVLISISGLQYITGGDSDNEAIEVISRGTYDFSDGIHSVQYEDLTESDDNPSALTKCFLSFDSRHLQLRKIGDVTVQMQFEEGKSHMSYYNTHYGDFCINITTSQIEMTETPEQIDIQLRYDLEFNYQFVSECTLIIKISSTE